MTAPFLIKKTENLVYLLGAEFGKAEGWLLLKSTGAVFLTGGLEHYQTFQRVDLYKNIGKYLKNHKTLNVEYGFTFGEGKYLKQKLQGIKIQPAASPVDDMRQVKEVEELKLMQKSMDIVARVFGQVKSELRTKIWTEKELAQFITNTGMKLGAEAVSFPPIVASGPNAAIPHHVPSDKRLKAGEGIILDFGFKYQGYVSDFTRTIFLKSVPAKLATAYRQTEATYLASMDFINRGPYPVSAGKVYDTAVRTLAAKKLDKYFIHSLGHGSGLEIHELPNLSPKSKDKLVNGMVFSIEPGVYIKGLGGIRIEDLVYMKKDKCHKFIEISTKLEDNIMK